MTITLTREEAQQVLDAFEVTTTHFAKDRQEILAAIETLRARLAQPEPEREQGDMPCIEDDGCPTEKAVLQRFWRKHRQPEPEPVAWHEPGAYGNVTVYKKWAEENGWLPLYKEKNT